MAENTQLGGGDKNNGKGSSPSQPAHSLPPISNRFTMGFMPYQSPQYGQPPNSFSNMPMYDGNYYPMAHQQGQFMNMLNAPLLHQQYHSPNASGVKLSPTSDNGSTPTSGCNKRVSIEEGVETSPNPKKKKKVCGKKSTNTEGDRSKVKKHLFWTPRYDDELIPFLANLARTGYKPDKTFKQSAFNMAATHINNIFNTEFKWQNVMHRIKSLRTRFHDMETCRNLSGAGWDEATKTVIMDVECFDRWMEDNKLTSSKLRDYINKPLLHYDDLATIIGDDQARGDFAADTFKKFKRTESITITDDDDDYPIPTNKTPNVSHVDDESTPRPTNRPLSSSSKANSSSSKGKGRRTNADTELMQQMVEEVKEFSTSLRCANMHWTEKVSNAIYTHLDNFEIGQLDAFLRHMFKNENESRLFICISKVGQKELIDSFLSKDE